MNKAEKILIFVLGLFCLFCTFMFIFNLEAIENMILKNHFPYIYAAIIIIITSGVGIELGSRIILRNYPEDKLIIIALVFSIYMFFIQLLLTIAPGISKCKCTTLSETLMNVSDWTYIKFSLGLLCYSLIVYLLIKINQCRQAT